jgi:hypothetical protein
MQELMLELWREPFLQLKGDLVVRISDLTISECLNVSF